MSNKYKIIFNDMGFSRKDIINKMSSPSKQWFLHLKKIVLNPDSRACSHWATEMWGWWYDLCDLVMKKDNKRLSWEYFYEWFLTSRFFEYEDSFNFERFNLSLKPYYEKNNLTPKILLKLIKENIRREIK